MKECPSCGAANRESASFCSLCMARFGQAPDQQFQDVGPVPDLVGTDAGTMPNHGGPLDPMTVGASTAPPIEESFRAGLPPTVTDVQSALKQRPVSLLSSMELLGEAFIFWWENVRFYLLFGLFMTVVIIWSMSTMFTSVISAGSGLTPESIFVSFLKAYGLLVAIAVIGYAALLTGTVKLAQHYQVGVFNSIVGGLLNLKSIIWLVILQGLVGGAVVFALNALALLSGVSQFAAFLNFPVMAILSCVFILAMFAFLDQEIKGFRALSTAVKLIGPNWLRVIWRFTVLSVVVLCIQIGSSFMFMMGMAIQLFFLPGFTVIYAWLVYDNLKKLGEAAQFSQAPAA